MVSGFRVQSKDISHVGQGLQRPETVETRSDGSVWTCDARGFVRIGRDGSQTVRGNADDRSYLAEPDINVRMSDGLLPTGFAFLNGGDIIFASFGEKRVCRMSPKGEIVTVLNEVDGVTLARPNAVVRDSRDRIWVSVSTRVFDWTDTVLTKPDEVLTGFVVLIDNGKARIVADGLRFANACRVDADGRYFYVAETFGQCITRFAISQNGDLINKEQCGPTFDGPIDGFAFDAANNIWVTQPMAERILVATPAGEVSIVADFGNAKALVDYQAALDAGRVDFNLAARCASPELGAPTSIVFGGEDLKTAYVGALLGDRIASFRVPVAGMPPAF
jgi:sugar lactone lactonase YvrE